MLADGARRAAATTCRRAERRQGSWARVGGGGGAAAGRAEGWGEGIGCAWLFLGWPDCDLGLGPLRALLPRTRLGLRQIIYFLFSKPSFLW